MARTKKIAVNQEKLRDKPVDLDIYKFITPDEADNAIKAHIEDARKCRSNGHPWPSDLLLIRNSIIVEYICRQGLSNYNCALQISSRWGIAVKTAQAWIREAMSCLAEYAETDLEKLRQKHIERLEDILEDALNNGSNDVALKSLDQLSKILGLNVDKKDVKLSGGDEPIKFDFGE